jgi:uncharacterized membrane protein
MKKELPAVILLIIPFALILIFWNQFPEKIPINWSLSKESEFFTGKTVGLFFGPILNLIFYLLFLFLPRIVVRDEIKLLFNKSYFILRYAVTIILFVFFMTIFFVALGAN